MTMTAEALRALRARTQSTIAEMTHDFQAVVNGSADANADDEHDPEGATIAFERAQISALLDSAQHTLAEIDMALERVEAGSYGRCDVCGETIGQERLAARPIARRCIACAAPRRCG